MKDYTFNEIEQKKFILNFNIVEEKDYINVFMADGTIKKVINNPNNVNILLNMMKNQVKKHTNFLPELKNKVKK